MRLTKRISDNEYSISPYRVGEAIDKLGALEDLEESARLVKLPCKVGDTIFFPNVTYKRGKTKFNILPMEVVYFEIGDSGEPITLACDDNNNWEAISVDDFGKTVFLTREAAEAGRQGEQAAKPPTSPALEGAEQ